VPPKLLIPLGKFRSGLGDRVAAQRAAREGPSNLRSARGGDVLQAPRIADRVGHMGLPQSVETPPVESPATDISMVSFEQFLADSASRGEAVNTLFEERLFGLVGILHKITDTLTAEHIPHEVIGGLAVLIYVEEANPEQTALTRDVDLMVLRSDLERIKSAASRQGFRFRHVAGVDMLIFGDVEPARNAVHLIFSGEKVRPNYVAATPPIKPERKHIHGKEVMVIPVADLVQMKLTSFRDKDRVHVRSLDAVGLVTEEVERKLTPELLPRLKKIRETE